MDPSANFSSCSLARCDNPAEHSAVSLIEIVHARNQARWRHLILHFTPSWFSVVMGTGIVSVLLHDFPYPATWLLYLSTVLFAFNVLLFVLFSLLSAARYIMFPGLWMRMLSHPVQSLFLGTVPMGLSTLVNMTVYVCVPAWGYPATLLAWALWWLAVVLSVATCFYLPFITMYRGETRQLSSMTAAWLLPLVAPIVAASSGALVASVLEEDDYALWTIITSYILWGCGVPLSMFTLVIYFQRLTLFHLPPREVIVSVFLPLGPFGQGGFGIIALGRVARELFPRTHTIPTATVPPGEAFYALAVLTALVMWGFGLVWLFFAVASIVRVEKFPFDMGWWGFVFPLGVYAGNTVALAHELPSEFFKVLGTVFSVVVTLLWVGIAGATAWKTGWGEIISAPCVREWEKMEVEKERARRKGGAEV